MSDSPIRGSVAELLERALADTAARNVANGPVPLLPTDSPSQLRTARPRWRLHDWTMPVLIAAVVALVIGGSVTAIELSSQGSSTPPVSTVAPAPSMSPVITSSSTPSNTVTPSPSTSAPRQGYGGTPPLRAVTADQLLTAPVPSMCGHPAGKLVDGRLPGVPLKAGSVELATVDGKNATDVDAFGDLNGDGIADAAVIINCGYGGVTVGVSHVVFYGAGPKALGSIDMNTLLPGTRNGNATLTYQNGAVVINSLEARTYDLSCCATGHAMVTLRWDGQKVVAGAVQHLVGPTDITFAGVGAVQLGMLGKQLTALDYSSNNLSSGCVQYVSKKGTYVLVNPHTDKVVKIRVISDTGYQTAIGGIKVGSSLASVQQAFKDYEITTYLHNDFGQGGNGIVVTGPGGSMSFTVKGAPTIAADTATVSSIAVAAPGFTTEAEVSCT